MKSYGERLKKLSSYPGEEQVQRGWHHNIPTLKRQLQSGSLFTRRYMERQGAMGISCTGEVSSWCNKKIFHNEHNQSLVQPPQAQGRTSVTGGFQGGVG